MKSQIENAREDRLRTGMRREEKGLKSQIHNEWEEGMRNGVDRGGWIHIIDFKRMGGRDGERECRDEGFNSQIRIAGKERMGRGGCGVGRLKSQIENAGEQRTGKGERGSRID